MRVIAEKDENPNLPKERVSCTGEGYPHTGCGRLLEITPVDVKCYTYTSWDGPERQFSIKCPICDCRTAVYQSQFSTSFWRLVHR